MGASLQDRISNLIISKKYRGAGGLCGFFERFPREPVGLDDLFPRGKPGGDPDRARRQAEFRGEKFAERVVGFAVVGGCLDPDLQVFPQPADDPTARGTGDDFDGDFHGQGIPASEMRAQMFL